jgi:hypothetical protein
MRVVVIMVVGIVTALVGAPILVWTGMQLGAVLVAPLLGAGATVSLLALWREREFGLVVAAGFATYAISIAPAAVLVFASLLSAGD